MWDSFILNIFYRISNYKIHQNIKYIFHVNYITFCRMFWEKLLLMQNLESDFKCVVENPSNSILTVCNVVLRIFSH